MSQKKFDQSRRSFLAKPVKAVPAVALVSTGLGDVVTASAQIPGVPGTTALTPNMDHYQPTYFHDDEWAFIKAAVDVLIPEDEIGPGALKAGVPEYIDLQMQTPYAMGKLWYMTGPFSPELMAKTPGMGYQLNMNPQQVYRSGISAFNTWCEKTHGKKFSDLDKETQLVAMQELSDKKVTFDDQAVPVATFFSQLWANTKEGFFADPIYGGNKGMVGWKMVGFPGARADYMDWIDHHNKPYPFGPVSITAKKS